MVTKEETHRLQQRAEAAIGFLSHELTSIEGTENPTVIACLAELQETIKALGQKIEAARTVTSN